MRVLLKMGLLVAWLAGVGQASGQVVEQVVDIPTRPGVTQRLLVLPVPQPRAAVLLFAGGNGGLQISPAGAITQLEGNFLVRTRQQFAQQGVWVAVVDAPSDRQSPPYLSGFRQTAEHVADAKATLAWVREQVKVPVWLVGTSRGTQSVAYIATQLPGPQGPDGLVLTSTIFTEDKGRAVPAMALGTLRIPVLVVHHEQDGCRLCPFSAAPAMLDQLTQTPAKQLLAFTGGRDRGDPCEAAAHHGFNGIERDVVTQSVAWILSH